MKKIILLILFTLFCSCETKSQNLVIPDKVEMANIKSKIVVKGTRVLIDKPENYSYYNELKRFQKDKNNFFQIAEYLNQDCNAVIEKTSNKIDELESKGGKVRIKKKFKLGEYDAYFGIAPQGETEQIILIFGDKTRTTKTTNYKSSNDRKSIF